MKQKYVSCAAALLLLSLFLFSCGQNAAAADSEGESNMEEFIEYRPAKTIGPTKTLTLEDQIAGVQSSYENVSGFYARMQDLAAADNANRKGKKLAAKVEKEYADRLEELAQTDFSAMTSEELLSLSLELTDMSAAIREALDQLTLE